MRTAITLCVLAVSTAVSSNSAPPNSYIVKFKGHVDDSAAANHYAWIKDGFSGSQQDRLELRKRSVSGATDNMIKHTFVIGTTFRGYSGSFDEVAVDKIRDHADVEYIEEDTQMCTTHATNTKQATTQDNCNGETENNAPWGLARISHRETLNFGTFRKYLYSAGTGEGVDIYVLDTGCNIDHVDFEGRAKWATTIPEDDEDEDGNGHGTHCAGTIAGKKYGVAKKAIIQVVKVLRSNGCGVASDVIKGIEFSVKRHNDQVKVAKSNKLKVFKGSVANLSLGGRRTQSLDDAVNAGVDAGVHFAVSAGNDNVEACDHSPASAEKAITVGASGLDDSRAYFSNYGKCTDIFAPGLSVQSAWIGSKQAVNTISGTSMGAAHVTGLLAYYLSLQPADDSGYAPATAPSPQKLKEYIISVATKGALSDLPDSDTPNLLAWNGGGCSDVA